MDRNVDPPLRDQRFRPDSPIPWPYQHFFHRLVEVTSTGELGRMMSDRFSEAFGHNVSFSFGKDDDLYIAKFNALEAECWRRTSGNVTWLKGFSYVDHIPPPWPGATGLTMAQYKPEQGQIIANRNVFNSRNRLSLMLSQWVIDERLGHIFDPIPEFGAALATRHELTHGDYDARDGLHMRVPDFFSVDVEATRKVGELLDGYVPDSDALGLPSLSELPSKILKEIQESALRDHPQLVEFDEKKATFHISEYGATNKRETVAEAGMRVSVAGPRAGEANLIISSLGGADPAPVVAAAADHVLLLHQLRRHLDPETGHGASPAQRDPEIAAQFTPEFRHHIATVGRTHETLIQRLTATPGPRPHFTAEPVPQNVPVRLEIAPQSAVAAAAAGLLPVSALQSRTDDGPVQLARPGLDRSVGPGHERQAAGLGLSPTLEK